MPSLNSHLTISQSRDLTLMAVGKGTEQHFSAALSKRCLPELQAGLIVMRCFPAKVFSSSYDYRFSEIIGYSLWVLAWGSSHLPMDTLVEKDQQEVAEQLCQHVV